MEMFFGALDKLLEVTFWMYSSNRNAFVSNLILGIFVAPILFPMAVSGNYVGWICGAVLGILIGIAFLAFGLISHMH